LPVDRGQGGALQGARAAPDLPRARRPRPSIRTASRPRCQKMCSSPSSP
jgi:hypothetical protein